MSLHASPYPYATAPDIIRSHQKDAYFTGHLTNTLSDLHRRLLGARATHAFAPELRTLSSLLYFGLTTLPGNRTLGEEYCDLVQVDGSSSRDDRGSLPRLELRAGYIAGSILLPYVAGKLAPLIRKRLRKALETRMATLRQKGKYNGKEGCVWNYLLQNLSSLTSSAPVQAVTLCLFYFSGTYYELSKRLLSLRYVFTRTVPDTPDRAGYELLGMLLLIQLGIQGYLHIRSHLPSSSDYTQQRERSGFESADVAVSLDHDNAYGHANSDLLLNSGGGGGGNQAAAQQRSRAEIALTTHTPLGSEPHFSLADDKVMGYIKGTGQRKCTLCLEELRDPAATQCGHVFCWDCIGDWVREKPECPLCRREALVQHILPLRSC